MKTTKKYLRKIFIIFLIITMVIMAGLAYFFVYNKAPIIQGEIISQINYKENLKLDVYQPTKMIYDKAPVVVYIHGGAWITGSKTSINFNRFNGAINLLRNAGYAIVSPNYTLAKRNESPFPDCIIDVYDAIKWVEDQAGQYHFDIKNVGVFGESAGAHIAMITVFADPADFTKSLKLNVKINYVVDVYGPTDLEKLYNMSTLENINSRLENLPENINKHLDITQYLFGFDPENDSIKAQYFFEKYSPINYVNRKVPPTLIIHGNIDQLVPVEQSLALLQKLDSLQVENELHVLEDVNHGFFGASAEQKGNVQQWIVDFIDKHYYIY